MNVRNFVASTLLAAVLLLVVSVPLSTQQGSGSYDPWLDYNEDGLIDANDLHPLGGAYGSTGDPTKNVTIVGHATKLIKLAEAAIEPPSHVWTSEFISVDGYSKVSINALTNTSNCVYTLWAMEAEPTRDFEVDRVVGWQYLVKTYDVMNQKIGVVIVNGSTLNAMELYVYVYLMA